MSDILKRLTGESALPVYSSIEKFKRAKDGFYFVAEDFNETVKKRELVNAKERLRVSVGGDQLEGAENRRVPPGRLQRGRPS